jgi:signal transduction histidine kinase
LTTIAEEVLEELRVLHSDREFKTIVAGPCVGRWDRDRLIQVCSNLFGNAIEHSGPDATIDIRLSGDDQARSDKTATVFSITLPTAATRPKSAWSREPTEALGSNP